MEGDSKQERYEGPVDVKLADYIHGLLAEKEMIDPARFPNITRLISQELDNLSRGGGTSENGFIDLYTDTPITVNVKALPPSKIFPKFNYAGRILGPKGAYLKSLMRETSTKMVLLGKGVMKNKDKEEELREAADPKFLHLNEDMHVTIQVTAPAAEAYARIAYAITCLKQQVVSDNRALENLPWISHATRILEGGSAPNSQPPKRSQTPPVPRRSSRSTNYSSYNSRGGRDEFPPPDDHFYEPSYRQYERESPPRGPYFNESYSRRPTGSHSSSSRAMEFVEKSRQSRGTFGGRNPHYEYDEMPGSHSHHPSDGMMSPWNSSGFQRGGKSTWSSESPRYTPYKK